MKIKNMNKVKLKIRNSLKNHLKRKKLKNKVHSSNFYLGCKFKYFLKWLEFQFTEKMNWKNYGKYWHIDHVLPISYFNFKKEKAIKKCFNYKNLQPLEAKENIIKGNKVDIELYNKQLKKLKIFKMIIKLKKFK